eukprot:6007054-Pleurochrysis_carterae.AAC.2
MHVSNFPAMEGSLPLLSARFAERANVLAHGSVLHSPARRSTCATTSSRSTLTRRPRWRCPRR